MKLQSYTITQGRDRAPARAMLKAIGFTDEDLAKPIIGVANTWIETMPCNYNLRELAVKVKEGIRAAGGTPMEFNTIAISDGVTMGTEGMKASLVSREVIADSIELVARGHMFDGIVALVACDKTIPGAAMALLRLNVPGVVLYGGSIMPGRHKGRDITIQDVFEAVGAQRRAARITDAELLRDRRPRLPRRRRLRRPVHRQHHGDRDGDDRALADGHGGGAAGGPAQGRGGVPLRRGHAERGAQEHRGRATSARAKRSRTPSPAWRPPAVRPTPCCTCWPWRAKPDVPLTIDDFETDQRAHAAAGGPEAGREVRGRRRGSRPAASAVIAKRLVEGGYVDGSAP